MVKTVETLSVDPEFEGLCRKLTPEELKLLEENLMEDGCREPIAIWRQKGVILDGHNRYSICRKNAIPFEIKELSFANRGDAINWIIANQLGKRNLNSEEKLYLWGKRYGVEKAQGKRTDLTSAQNEQKLPGGQNTTAEKIAAEYNVGQATIRRAEKFATAVDQVSEKSPEAKQAILSGRVDHQDVPALADAPADRLTQLAALPEDQQRKAAKEIAKGATPEAAHEAAETVEDANGEPVPEHLKNVLGPIRKELHQYTVTLARIRNRMKKIAEDALATANLTGNQLLELDKNLGQAHHTIEFAIAYAICPYCKGKGICKGETCPACKGAGWVNKTVYNSAPQELRA